MTAVDALSPDASGPDASGSDPGAGKVQFVGREGAYWRLRIKGATLVAITLGIYRFWLATDVRRYLWSNTEIAGDTLEYNGLATELLVGFLFAIAILVPLYMGLAIAALELDMVAVKPAVLGFLLLVVLGEYALYRARRYRLTRTVFRGLRFDQHGSAWFYALRALAWWAAVIVTLGLAYPWSLASLERFKMRNTSYGDLPGRFEGSGFRLFLRGLPMWLVVVGPIVAAIAVMARLIDWDALSNAIAKSDGDAFDKLVAHNPQLAEAVGFVVGAIGLSVLIGALLYPVFQAVLLRWWISGLRFGQVTVTSRLRIWQIYRTYLRFILYQFVFTLIAGIMGGMSVSIVQGLFRPLHDANVTAIGAGVILLVLYVVIMIGSSTIYQVVVAAGLWRLGAQSAELSGTQALDGVRASGMPVSALGEGLADALGVGSM
jgi:uncharacterized membrane protein YjgN (DUF898 family)